MRGPVRPEPKPRESTSPLSRRQCHPPAGPAVFPARGPTSIRRYRNCAGSPHRILQARRAAKRQRRRRVRRDDKILSTRSRSPRRIPRASTTRSLCGRAPRMGRTTPLRSPPEFGRRPDGGAGQASGEVESAVELPVQTERVPPIPPGNTVPVFRVASRRAALAHRAAHETRTAAVLRPIRSVELVTRVARGSPVLPSCRHQRLSLMARCSARRDRTRRTRPCRLGVRSRARATSRPPPRTPAT